MTGPPSAGRLARGAWRWCATAIRAPFPPGQAAASASQAAGLVERMLARVRGLLVKAEATEFDEEAEALTEKAQELIARHAVDEALVYADGDVGESSARRIPVDPPYAELKAAVVGQVGGGQPLPGGIRRPRRLGHGRRL